MLPKTLKLKGMNAYKCVDTQAYINAKYRQLKEFGYSTLTIDEVQDQLECVYWGRPTTIIGKFMEDEVIFGE